MSALLLLACVAFYAVLQDDGRHQFHTYTSFLLHVVSSDSALGGEGARVCVCVCVCIPCLYRCVRRSSACSAKMYKAK